jgi:competence protein ComEA
VDRKELTLAAILIGVIVLGLGVQQWRKPPGVDPVVIGKDALAPRIPEATTELRIDFNESDKTGLQAGRRMDLNRATEGQLQQVSGIGPALAKNVIRYRETHGLFRTLEEVLEVPGIGPSRLANLAELFEVPDSSYPDDFSPDNRARFHSSHEEHRDETVQQSASKARGAASVLRLDLNRATAEELQQLSGIGPAISSEIVRYRQSRGGFRSVEELVEVPGIGPKRLEQFRPSLFVEGVGGPGAFTDSTAMQTSDTISKQTGSSRISLNRAGAEELEKLPGIGPALAGRIIQYRQVYGPFQTLEEIQEVSGIGEKTYARLLPYIEL